MFLRLLSLLLLVSTCGQAASVEQNNLPVDESLTKAKTSNDFFISWVEHIIDDPITSSEPFNGSDGLVMKDLDLDGFDDIVSVHESDAAYDSAEHEPNIEVPLLGHVRIAFGTKDPLSWNNITLASGPDVAAPEDAAIGDLNKDGFPDIVVAAELGHVIYFQNPARGIRTTHWPRLILPFTKGRGSYLRTFLQTLTTTTNSK